MHFSRMMMIRIMIQTFSSYSPIDARGRSEIDESIRDIISENLETKKIHVLALQSIFTEDTGE
jgi:hypothetical protein